MDGQVPEVAPKASFFSQRLVILAGAVLLLLLIPGIFYISNQGTQKKGEAPKATTIVPDQKASPTPNQFQKGPFFCPSTPTFCQNGQDVVLANAYSGMGGKLPANSPIYAAFDGEVKVTTADPKNPVKVLLSNKQSLIRAGYFFYGTVTKSGVVKRGEIIATTTGQPMNLYLNNSLVFILTRNDPTSGEELQGIRYKLTPNDFSN